MDIHRATISALPIKLYSCSLSSNNHIIQIEEGDFAASHHKTEKLEEEKKLLRAELNHCVEKVHAFYMLFKWVLINNFASLNKSIICICVQMAQLRSAETQLAQVLQERQMADKHNQALRTQMIKAQEKVRIPICRI